MTDTINRGYPYPRLRGDGADVSYWLQQLAENLDLDVQELADRITQRTTAVPYTLTLGAGWKNVSTPLMAVRSGDLVVITGRVVRASGSSSAMTAALPEYLLPEYMVYAATSGENAGNTSGPTFQLSIGTANGQGIGVDARNGGDGSWTTSTWIPVNIAYMARPAA